MGLTPTNLDRKPRSGIEHYESKARISVSIRWAMRVFLRIVENRLYWYLKSVRVWDSLEMEGVGNAEHQPYIRTQNKFRDRDCLTW